MKTFIPLLLERTPEDLNKIKFHLFLEWAMKSGYNDVDAQHLVTNQKLYNWFNGQVSLLENEFIESIANGKIAKKSKSELFAIWNMKIEKVKQLFPRLILQAARKGKKQILSTHNLN